MTTTSLKLSEELKQRAISVAQQQGISPHAFMVDAIEKAASSAEKRASFLSEARAAEAEMLETGKGYDAAEVHDYLKARAAGVKTAKPKVRSWRS
jgi:predicted transcriptional regulator